MIDMDMGKKEKKRAIVLLTGRADHGHLVGGLFGEPSRIDQQDRVRGLDKVRIRGDGIDLPDERIDLRTATSGNRLPD